MLEKFFFMKKEGRGGGGAAAAAEELASVSSVRSLKAGMSSGLRSTETHVPFRVLLEMDQTSKATTVVIPTDSRC